MLLAQLTSHGPHLPRGSTSRAWMVVAAKMAMANAKLGTATIARRAGRPVTPESRPGAAVLSAALACSTDGVFLLASSHPLAARFVPEFSLNGCASEPDVLERDLRGGGDAARDGRASATSTGAMVQHGGRGRGTRQGCQRRSGL